MSRKLSIDPQFDYDRLIDMSPEQLSDMLKECEINMERIRVDIVKNYKLAQPYLMQMRTLKIQFKKVGEKLEAVKTFLSMEKNGSLVSNIDLSDLKKYNSPSETPIETPREEMAPAVKPRKPVTKFKSPLVMNWVNKGKDQTKLKKSSTTTNLRK